MRKIDLELIAAIQQDKPFNKANTKIIKDGHLVNIYLYNSKIASYSMLNKIVEINFDGYLTQTTKNRINAVLKALMPLNNIVTFFKKGEVFISYDGDIEKVHFWNSYFIDIDRV